MNADRRLVAMLRTLLLSWLVVIGLIGAGPSPRPASAQGDAFFPVFVLACDAYVKMKGSAAGFGYPPECRGIEGVTVTTYDTLGNELDDCTTGSDGTCRLAIDYNGTRIFRQSTDAIPEGYRTEQNADVMRVFTYTEFAEIAFHNYREDVLPQRDGATATVRVHSRDCPAFYQGDTFFDDCDSGVPTTNQWIFGNGRSARAGEDGNAILRDMPAGDASEIIGGQSYQTGDIFFYCSKTDDASVRVNTSLEVTAQYDGITRDFVGKVDLEPGDDVTCDWYQIPFLDRGLWDTVVNPLAEGDDKSVAFGNIALELMRCDEGVIPEPETDLSQGCNSPELNATVRVLAENGDELFLAETNDAGRAELMLSGMRFQPFSVTLESHASTEQDLVICMAGRSIQGGATDPLQQLTVTEGAGWSVPGYGDDVNGITCFWYLAPTGS